jgi:hypothetical protein
MADEAGTTSVQQLAAHTLGVPFDHLLVGRIESEFPWLKTGGILWARTVDFKSVLFWVRDQGPPIWLNPPELKGLPGLSIMLSQNVGDLPGNIKPVELAEAVRKLAVEPRGYVASQEFLKKHTPYLAGWLKEDNQKTRNLFAQQCADPVLDKVEGKPWKLSFAYFNPQGGVEKWVVEGDANHVASAKKSEGLADGTFRWPFR